MDASSSSSQSVSDTDSIFPEIDSTVHSLIPQVHCKTFLRTTMTQLRLNNSMILFVHSKLTDKINLVELGNEFIRGSEHRHCLASLR